MFLSVLFFLGLVSAGLSIPNYTVSKSTFEPGDVGIATITVTNPTGSARVTGITMTIFNPSDIIISSSPRMADIDSGGTAIVSLPVRIAKETKPGIYLVNVDFTGFTSGTIGQTSVTNTVSIPFTVVHVPIISMDAQDDLISGVDTISINITNNGGPASQARIRLAGTSDIALFGSNEYYVGTLAGPQKILLSLDARSADDGPVDVPFILTYNDEIGTTHTDTITLRLTVKNDKLDLRFNQLSPIKTREAGMLKLEVENSGEQISDVRISFTGAGFRLTDSGEIKIGDLAANEKAIVTANVLPILSPGLNLVGAKVSWVEKGISKEQEMDIPITIASDSDVAVYLESKPSPLVSGTEHTISVLVSNIGSYGIDNVDVGISSGAFTLLDITPRQYVGSLAQDDFSTVQFRVMTKSPAGEHPITINVRYRDASGEWVNKALSQSASITAPASTGNGTNLMLLVAGAVAVVLVWYFKFRKKG